MIGSGGGISQYETEPSFQQGVQSTGYRTTPDVSTVADPATGAWIADPYNLDPSNPFEAVGGTSLSAPIWAGLVAMVNQGRRRRRRGRAEQLRPERDAAGALQPASERLQQHHRRQQRLHRRRRLQPGDRPGDADRRLAGARPGGLPWTRHHLLGADRRTVAGCHPLRLVDAGGRHDESYSACSTRCPWATAASPRGNQRDGDDGHRRPYRELAGTARLRLGRRGPHSGGAASSTDLGGHGRFGRGGIGQRGDRDRADDRCAGGPRRRPRRMVVIVEAGRRPVGRRDRPGPRQPGADVRPPGQPGGLGDRRIRGAAVPAGSRRPGRSGSLGRPRRSIA